MTLIYGIATTSNQVRNLNDILKLQYRGIFANEKETTQTKINKNIAFGHHTKGVFNTYDQPFYDQESGTTIVFCGHLFGKDELKHELNQIDSFKRANSNIDIIHKISKQPNIKLYSNLNGLFAAAIWDEVRKSLTLITDRYGVKILYYYHDYKSGSLVFSTDIKGVIESSIIEHKVNWSAWNTFFSFGHHLGDETPFKNVYTVPPASVLIFEDNTIKIEKYWDIANLMIDESMSYSTAVEGCAELFSKAIKRRNISVQGSKTVFLSGGLDSRRIAAELEAQNIEFDTYTTQGFSPVDNESGIAKQVADRLGVKNTFIDLPNNDFFKNYWAKANSITGYETNLHQWILPFVESIPNTVKVNYDGLAGDLIARGVQKASVFYNHHEYLNLNKFSLKELSKKMVSEKVALKIFNKKIQNQLNKYDVLERVELELSKYASTVNWLTCFLIMNRTRRGISLCPFRIVQKKIESICPFLDNDLFDFTLSIPLNYKLNNSLRQDIIKLAFPKLYKIARTEIKKKDRNASRCNSIKYYSQRREHLRTNISQHFIKNNWIFSNPQTIPRIVKEVIYSTQNKNWPTSVFCMSFLVFFEWLEKYFDSSLVNDFYD